MHSPNDHKNHLIKTKKKMNITGGDGGDARGGDGGKNRRLGVLCRT